MISKRTIAFFFLIFPLFLHWFLPDGRWEMLFTTFGIGRFKYSWIAIFYLLYLLYSKGRKGNRGTAALNFVFLVSLTICGLSLVVSNGGNYSFSLFLSAIPFYIAPLVLINHPVSPESAKVFKPFIYSAYGLNVLVYIMAVFFGKTLISVDLEDIGNNFFYRPSTFVGGPNASSFFLFLVGAFIAEIYIKKSGIKFLFSFFVLGLIIAGACRGALVAQLFYMFVAFFKNIGKIPWQGKIVLVLTVLAFFYVAQRINLFEDVIQRNEEQVDKNDITSGREVRVLFVLNNTLRDSPLIGVGHGRVFSSSKDLLYQYNEKNFTYSNYHGAPHNVWALVFAEYGYIGFALFIIGVICVLSLLNYHNNLSYVLVISIFVLMNTESILIQDDFWPFLWIIFCYASVKPPKKQRSIIHKHDDGHNIQQIKYENNLSRVAQCD